MYILPLFVENILSYMSTIELSLSIDISNANVMYNIKGIPKISFFAIMLLTILLDISEHVLYSNALQNSFICFSSNGHNVI